MTTHQSIHVRPALRTDAGIIVNFNRAMAMETESVELPENTLRAGVAAVLADPSKGFYLIAEFNLKPRAVVLVTSEWSDWRNAQMWWIHSVYVSPESRGHGLYRALHSAVLDMARRSDSVKGLRLYVDKANRTAQGVYRSMGMTQSHYLMFEQELKT